jgi:hypothetical protein
MLKVCICPKVSGGEDGFTEMGLDIKGIVVGLEEWVGLADKGTDVGDVGIGVKPMLFGDFDPTKDDIAGGKVRVVPPPMHHWGYHCHLRGICQNP